ncbi:MULTISPECIES: hypothetical protein [Sorangium]|uniref:Uncharacterized protein n=1 Tax=Sorangium cellulosum TaxID=56 RepID=A0A4P2QTY9_SORCE|nr:MULTISPECIES: hypothetical protein [Sorangium]AUX33521.1 hypothetical protein SOCE836_056810 [Sorangium cellulosum]WCQ92837.1 hypothetical protein NQZ70_05583 [Sorangium sp. Soce836]
MTKSSTPVTKKKPAPRKPAAPPQAAAAYDRALPEIEALSPEQLIAIKLDIPRAVSQVLGVLPGLLALRPAIAEALHKHDIALLDRLETYALAAWYAHLLWLSTGAAESALKPLLAEAAPLRENLLGDAEALARRGLLDADAVAEIRAGQGHIDTANDLVALSALFSGSWPEISGKTAATEEEVKRAGEIGPQLLAALGVREHGKGPGPTEAADKRARAFALLAHAYDQTRRAVAYLRWNEGDAETIAPSIYKSRGGRATGASDDGPEPDDAEEAAAPTGPDAGTAPAPSAGAAPAAVPPGPGPQAQPGAAPPAG